MQSGILESNGKLYKMVTKLDPSVTLCNSFRDVIDFLPWQHLLIAPIILHSHCYNLIRTCVWFIYLFFIIILVFLWNVPFFGRVLQRSCCCYCCCHGIVVVMVLLLSSYCFCHGIVVVIILLLSSYCCDYRIVVIIVLLWLSYCCCYRIVVVIILLCCYNIVVLLSYCK